MTEGTLLESGRTLGVIGAGVMGQTLMKGLLNAGLVSRRQMWAGEKSQTTCDEVAEKLEVTTVRDYREAAAGAGILLVCVKPAQAPAVTAALREAGMRPDTLLISILAGVSTERLESLLKLPNAWVRAMPNTPCIVGQGMTVVCGGTGATAEHLALAERIFSSVGRCAVVEEHYCNAITALSGSGPAYMYLVMEALAALQVLAEEGLIERAARLGALLLNELKPLEGGLVREVRGRGLLVGLELSETARPWCERLADLGVLCKETHERVIRLAPPLVIGEEDLLWMVAQVKTALKP